MLDPDRILIIYLMGYYVVCQGRDPSLGGLRGRSVLHHIQRFHCSEVIITIYGRITLDSTPHPTLSLQRGLTPFEPHLNSI